MRSFVFTSQTKPNNDCVDAMRTIVVAYAAGETFSKIQIVFETFIIYGIRR
jgi:hypothetical protein